MRIAIFQRTSLLELRTYGDAIGGGVEGEYENGHSEEAEESMRVDFQTGTRATGVLYLPKGQSIPEGVSRKERWRLLDTAGQKRMALGTMFVHCSKGGGTPSQRIIRPEKGMHCEIGGN